MTITVPKKYSDENLLFTKDILEQDLIDQVSKWAYRVLFYVVGSASLCLYLIGEQNYINPFLVSLVTFLAGHYKLNQQIQWIIRLVALTVLIVRHALSQGCSASLVPSIYGFIPCAFAFLFRTKRVVVLSTILVLVATITIFAVDLGNHCTTTPIQPHQTFYIIADRLLPLLVLICGNSLIIIAIVQQSQKAISMHSEAAQQSQQLALLRKNVLHRVTHELRTPLVGLVGSVDLLIHSPYSLSDYDMDNVLTLKASLNHILRICDDVLMAAKQQQRQNSEKQRASLFVVASLIDDVCDVFTNNSKHILLQVEYDGIHIYNMVRGQEVELRQVLLNLVGNAMKFTDDNGKVTLRVQQQQQSRYKFEVQDTGIGIAKNISPESLFEPFQQATPAISSQYKGTGLGLTICKEFVERMGGTISVESEGIGLGSSFSFIISLEQYEQDSDVRDASTRSCRVVIADSERSSVVSCRSIVKSIQPSAHITAVNNPSELMDMVQQDKNDEQLCVAFVGCDEMDTKMLQSTLVRLNAAGWIVFAYCCHDSFAHLLSNSNGTAYATFRRPLPLIRLRDAFRGALLSGGGDRPHAGNDTAYGNIPRSRTHSSKMFKPPVEKDGLIELPEGSKIVVVDDTPLNVKVLVRMLSRSTSAPVVSCLDGQSAIELVESSHKEDVLLFLMDWHMPGLCGLTATEAIRTSVRKRGGPKLFVCMVTADAEGLQEEMFRRHMSLEGIVQKGQFVAASSVSSGESNEERSAATSRCQLDDASSVSIDILVEKPIPFSSIPIILRWFQEKLKNDAD